MAGVDLLTTSELMGHKTIQMTKGNAHLAPAHNQASVDRLVGCRPSSEPEQLQPNQVPPDLKLLRFLTCSVH
jgi:hypothetical protein